MQHLQQAGDIGRLVRGGQRQAQPRAADGDSRRANGRRPAAFLTQTRRQPQRAGVVADDQRLDRAAGISELPGIVGHSPAKVGDMAGQRFPPLLTLVAANHGQRGAQRHRLRRRHGGAVNQMAGKLQQIIRQRLAAQHRRAADAKRFTEGDDKQIRAYLLRVAAAAPLFAERADTVRVVNQQSLC